MLICVGALYDLVWVPLFDESYFRWYIENGALVNVVLGLAAIGVNLDDQPDCISADPDRYFTAWGVQFGKGLEEFSRGREREPSGATSGLPARHPHVLNSRSLAVPGLDSVLTIAFIVFWGLALVVFAVFILPAQYIVFLVAGAPARRAVDSVVAAPNAYASKPVTFTIAVAAIILFAVGFVVDG